MHRVARLSGEAPLTPTKDIDTMHLDRLPQRGLRARLGGRDGLTVGRFLTATVAITVLAAATTPSRSHTSGATGSDSLPPVLSNDNRAPAGRLEHGILTLRLEARAGIWRPEGQH